MTSARTRLAGFAVVLAALVAGGYAVGTRFPTDGSPDHGHEPVETPGTDEMDEMDEMDGMDHGDAP